MVKENEQLLKNVKPQAVNSLVQTPRSDNPASGNGLRDCLQRFVTLEKSIQFTKVYEDASFCKRVSIVMSYQTIPDVDYGWNPSMHRVHTSSCRFGFQNLCRNPRTNSTWPVLQVHIIQFLGTHGIEILHEICGNLVTILNLPL